MKEGSDQEREGERKRARVNSYVVDDFSLLLLTLPLPLLENENDPRPPLFLVTAETAAGELTGRGRPSRTRHEAKAVVARKNRASLREAPRPEPLPPWPGGPRG